jgi:pyrroline-5-carboxylate reductase
MQSTIIGFIGGGNMSTSLMSGLVESGFDKSAIWVADRNTHKLERLANEFHIKTSSSTIEVAAIADVLVLGVKPQDMKAVCLEIRDIVGTRKPLIVSIAAAIQTSHFERWLGNRLPIVRCMPNTPALLRAGATGLYANGRVSEEQRSRAESLLRAVGITVWVDHEHDLEIVAALSGSGPAYFFLIMEALQEGAKSLGLSEDTAKILTLQTALGAARMALESNISLEELRTKVASKGGTTEKALSTLESGGIRELIKKALTAARDRSLEISKHFAED